jgi:hypothetical protein
VLLCADAFYASHRFSLLFVFCSTFGMSSLPISYFWLSVVKRATKYREQQSVEQSITLSLQIAGKDVIDQEGKHE